MNKFFKIKYILLSIIFFPLFSFFALHAQAVTGTIDATYNTAKFVDSTAGTVNFKCDNCSVQIDDTSVTGNAWGNVTGWINFNPTNSGVSNTIAGILSGNAWGQNAGWINFNPTNGGVSISISTGEFTGYAWSENYGWLKFDCSSAGKIAGECVVTDWRYTAPSPFTGGGTGIIFPDVDLCSNIPDMQNPIPGGYAPDIRPEHLGECVLIVNDLNIEFIFPEENDTLLSADATQQEIDSLPTPKPLSANFKLQAKITSGVAEKVEFSTDGGITWSLGSLNNSNGFYESLDPWQQSVRCDDINQPKVFVLKVRATDITGLIVDEKEVHVVVGRVPCVPSPTQCSDGADNDSDGKIDFIAPIGSSSFADPDCTSALDDNESGNFCDIHIENVTCFCAVPENQNDIKCKTLTFCEIHPNDSSCVVTADICATDITLPGCSTYICDTDPNDPSCVAVVKSCKIDPSLPECISVCSKVPEDPSCADVVQNCEINPNLPGCVVLIDEAVCKTNPSDPVCVVIVQSCITDPTLPGCATLLNDLSCSTNSDDPSCVSLIQSCLAGSTFTGCDTLLNIVKGEQADCLTNPDLPSCKKIEVLPSLILRMFSPEVAQKVSLGLKVASSASAIISVGLSLAMAIFLNPVGLPELVLIPMRLWSLFLTAFGLKKRVKKWGTVYDSITKQPLDPVYVSLLNLKGEEVASSITDVDGRYGFFVKPGVYTVVPKKTNYIYPSTKLFGRFSDELYQDLYFGNTLSVGEGEVIAKNIPLDPVGFDWNEFAKNKNQLFKFYSTKELWIARISNWMFYFGFTVAISALVVSPEKYNMLIVGLYVAMFVLRRTSFKMKAQGRTLDKEGLPLAFAVIRVLSAETNLEIAHKITDQMGRYYVIVPNGSYIVKIEKKNDDGSYSLVHTSERIEVTKGVLNKVFNI